MENLHQRFIKNLYQRYTKNCIVVCIEREDLYWNCIENLYWNITLKSYTNKRERYILAFDISKKMKLKFEKYQNQGCNQCSKSTNFIP